MAKNKDSFQLTDAQYRAAKGLQQRIKHTLEYLLKCDNCRYDVKDELEKTREQLDSLEKTINTFGPPKQ